MSGLRGEEIGELAVPYDPTVTAQRIGRRRQAIRRRIFSLGISLVVVAAIYFWQRDQITGISYFVLSAVAIALFDRLDRVQRRAAPDRAERLRVGRQGHRRTDRADRCRGRRSGRRFVRGCLARGGPPRFGSTPRLALTTTGGASASVLLEAAGRPARHPGQRGSGLLGQQAGVDLSALDALASFDGRCSAVHPNHPNRRYTKINSSRPGSICRQPFAGEGPSSRTVSAPGHNDRDHEREEVMALLNPYINFGGNAREAMEFYQSVFGGKLDISTFGDFQMPGISEDDVDLIMHSQLATDAGFTLMGSDLPPSMGEVPDVSNITVSISGERGRRDPRLLGWPGRRR